MQRPRPRSSIQRPNMPRLDYLDGLRAAAALAVVIHHAWLQAGLPTYLFGHYAVGLFIVISGFSLMLPVVRAGGVLPGGALPFFRRRARRILPPYYLAMAASLALIWLYLGHQPAGYYDESFDVRASGMLTHALLVHQLFPSTATQISGPFWSIAVEWWIYFLFPLFVGLFGRWGALRTVAAAFALSLALTLALLPTPLDIGVHGASPQYITLFVIGMLAAKLVHAPPGRLAALRGETPWLAVLSLASAALIGLAFFRRGNGALIPSYASDYVVGAWALALLMLCARAGSRLRAALSWRPLVAVGGFAYSIYLMHFPLLRLFWQCLLLPTAPTGALTFAILVLVAVPLVVGVCYLFFLAAERPFLARRPASAASDTVASPSPAA